jgi:hypothetical protein
MKIFKPLALLIFVTILSLVYVHQQIELVKLSYAMNIKEKRFKDMLDYKDTIGYNIKNLESPSRLQSILVAKNIDITFPKVSQIVPARERALRFAQVRRVRSVGTERRFDLFGIFDFFSPRAEAQANER